MIVYYRSLSPVEFPVKPDGKIDFCFFVFRFYSWMSFVAFGE